MGQVRSALRSTTVRVLGAAMLLLGVVTVTPMLSGAASAHRANIEAEVACDGTVEWTASSWSKAEEGSNDDVRVHRRGDDGEAQEVGHGSFSDDNGYTFEGHFSWPEGEKKIVVSTEPKGEWGNGEDPDDEGHDEVELERPDCDDDAHVEHEVQCDSSAAGYGDGEVTLTLHNPEGPWGDDAEFQVYQPDDEDEHETYAVPAGGSRSVTYQGLDEGSHRIKVTEGDDDHSRDVEIDCDQQVPSVTASQSCVAGDGSVTVNLANTGGEAVTFRVTDPVSGDVEEVEVQPNSSASRTFVGLEDGEHTVTVKVGDTDLSQHFDVDCDDEQYPPHDDEDECPVESTTTTVEEHETSTSEHGSSTSDDETSTSEDETSTSEDDTSTSEDETASTEKGSSTSEQASSSSTGSYDRTLASRTATSGGYSTSTSVEDDEHSTSTSSDDDHTGSTHDDTSSTDDGEHTSSTGDGEHTSSTEDDDHDDDPDDCVPKGEGSIEVAKVCVAADGQVTVTLIATGGVVTFTVEGTTYVVQPGEPRQVVIAGLSDGSHTIDVMAGYQDLSFVVDVSCDVSPRVTVSQQCVGFDGAVTFLLENLGDDADATFTIAGVDHVVAPGASTSVVFDGLVDGPHTFTVAINGIAMPDVTVTVECNPTFDVVAQCNAVSVDGGVEVYWFTITNTESVDVDVAWDGGAATVPAGESRTVGSLTAPLTVSVGGEVVATAAATEVVCSRSVTIDKALIGGPDAPETYTVTISRLVGATYVEVTTVPLVAGQPTTVTLPSTLDPAGVQYLIEETDRGTAVTSVVSPSELTLSGHLGETVSVVVTNGYASVQIDKTVSATQVGLGDDLVYTLVGRNTGGLTLNDVVVSDRLPAGVAYVSATVDGGAGSCSLTEATRPQLFTCDLDGSLAAGGATPQIVVVVTVDDDTTLVGGALVNQAKIVGAYAAPQATARAAAADAATALSCEPVVDGTVCDLSAVVSTTVVGSEPPVTTTTVPGGSTTTTNEVEPPVPSPPPGPLPRSGSSPLPLVLLALGATLVGGVLLFGRRRA